VSGPVELVSVEDTWTRLSCEAGSVLVDVRTVAEWSYVGVPDLASIGKRPILVEWQNFPTSQVNSAFVDQVKEALSAQGADRTNEIFFICRSGVRSLRAAEAMAAAGYDRCRNVTDGFEGPLDAERHRGKLGGWKAKGLPWAQG
jgi:rhodanese-related sulfurtransferase